MDSCTIDQIVTWPFAVLGSVVSVTVGWVLVQGIKSLMEGW